MDFLVFFAVLFVIVWVSCAFDLLDRERSPGGQSDGDEKEYESQTWVCPSCGIVIDPTSETCPWCAWSFVLIEGDTALEDVASEEVGPLTPEEEYPGLIPEADESKQRKEVQAQTHPPTGSETALAEAVRAILAEDSIGGGRERLIRSLVGTDYAFELTVKRVERTMGRYSDPDYRNGRTVSGTIGATDIEVSVLFPAVLNDMIDSAEPGSSSPVRGAFSDWDGLRKRPTIRGEET